MGNCAVENELKERINRDVGFLIRSLEALLETNTDDLAFYNEFLKAVQTWERIIKINEGNLDA